MHQGKAACAPGGRPGPLAQLDELVGGLLDSSRSASVAASSSPERQVPPRRAAWPGHHQRSARQLRRHRSPSGPLFVRGSFVLI
jgi:hypothetical protein